MNKEIIGNATLYQGDCLEILPTLDKVDAVVTSPPYDNLRDYEGNNALWCDAVWKSVLSGLYKVTNDGAVVVWVVGDATINGSETGTSFKQALWAMECGFKLHDTMIYQVPGAGAKGSNNAYWQVFEYMFVFVNGKIKTVNRLKDKKNKKAGTRCTSNKQARDGVGTRLHPPGGTIVQEFGVRDNVWVIPSGNGHGEYTGHPAPFPEKLAQDHIVSWTIANNTILDPFMGSGTTGVACMHLGRKFIGIEIEQKYFDIACERIEQAQKQLSLFEQGVTV